MRLDIATLNYFQRPLNDDLGAHPKPIEPNITVRVTGITNLQIGSFNSGNSNWGALE